MGEDYVAVCRKTWIIILFRAVVGIIIFLFLNRWDGNALYTFLKIGVPLLLILGGVIEYLTNYIGVTRTKIVVHTGFIKTSEYVTPLSKIQAISISSGLLGKVFEYDKITIDHAGSGNAEYKFTYAVNAKDFVGVVQHLTGLR